MATETVTNNESIFDQLFREIEEDKRNNYNNIGINATATDSNANTNVWTNPDVVYQAELPKINIDDRNDIINDSYTEKEGDSSSLPPLGEDSHPDPMRQSWIEPVETSCDNTEISHLSQNSDDNSAEVLTLYEQPPLLMNSKTVASPKGHLTMNEPTSCGEIHHSTPEKNSVIFQKNAKVENFFIPSPENNFPDASYGNNFYLGNNDCLSNQTPPTSSLTKGTQAETPFLVDNEIMTSNIMDPTFIESEPNNNIMINGTVPDQNIQSNPTSSVPNVMQENKAEIPLLVDHEMQSNLLGPTVPESEPNTNIMSPVSAPDLDFQTNSNQEQKSPDLLDIQPKNDSSLGNQEGVTLNSVQMHTPSETRNPLHLHKQDDIQSQLLEQNNAVNTMKQNLDLPGNNNITNSYMNTTPSNESKNLFMGHLNTNQGHQFMAISQNEEEAVDKPIHPKTPSNDLSGNSQTIQMVEENIDEELNNSTDKGNMYNDRDIHKSLSEAFNQRDGDTKSPPPPWSHFGASNSSFETDETEEPIENYSNDDAKDHDSIVPHPLKNSTNRRCYKILLLLILFVSVAGIIVGALYIPSAFKSLSTSNDLTPYPEPFLKEIGFPSISPSFYPSVVPSSFHSPSMNPSFYPSVIPSSSQHPTVPKKSTSTPTLRTNNVSPDSTNEPSNVPSNLSPKSNLPSYLPSYLPSRSPTLRKSPNQTTSNISTYPTVTPTLSYLPSVSNYKETTTFSQVGVIRGLRGEGIGASVSMSVDGKRMVVGAHRWNIGSQPGVVRVYEYMTEELGKVSLWILVAEMRGEADDNSFGFSVAMSGDGTIIAIGVPGYIKNSGKVLVYKEEDETRDDWLKIGEIIGSSDEEALGMAVCLSHNGDQMAIGAPYSNLSKGKVYVYQNRDDAGWNLDGNQNITGNLDGDYFGYSVSISSDGSQLVVGAPQKHKSGRLGYASVYELNHSLGQWVNIGSLSNNYSEPLDDGFGYSVAQSLNGTRILIGSPRYMNGTGLIRMYEKDYETKNLSIVYEAAGPSTNSSLGYSVDMSLNGSVMAITSPGIYKVEILKLDSGKLTKIVINENNITEDYGSVISISKNGTYISLGSPQLSMVQVYQLEW